MADKPQPPDPKEVKKPHQELLEAMAKVNGHPNPAEYADAVHAEMEKKDA